MAYPSMYKLTVRLKEGDTYATWFGAEDDVCAGRIMDQMLDDKDFVVEAMVQKIGTFDAPINVTLVREYKSRDFGVEAEVEEVNEL